MRPGRSSFVGGFLGSALQGTITHVTRRTIGPLLFSLTIAAALVVRWWQAQPLWMKALLVLLGVLLVVRPWRWDRRTRAVVAAVTPTPLDEQVTFLYRWRNADDELLYVGISNDLARRTGQHIADKPWMATAVRCDATSYPNRRAALEAEEQAIYAENPKHNIVFNRGPAW